MEHRKRLCDLVNLEENNRSCVVLTVKPETSPLDLVRLGGFEGHECMFRMSKDPRTTCITVFYDGGEPVHMSYGSSNTLVGEALRSVRDQVMECVNLDFGIYTHGGHESVFDSLARETSGPRDLDSRRSLVLKRTPSYASLFVNDQHIDNILTEDLETWLADRNACLFVRNTEKAGNVEIDYGTVVRVFEPELEKREPPSEQERFERAVDGAVSEFLGKRDWHRLDPPGIVVEFAEFAKGRGIDRGASLDDAMGKGKQKAAERNAERDRNAHSRKPPESER